MLTAYMVRVRPRPLDRMPQCTGAGWIIVEAETPRAALSAGLRRSSACALGVGGRGVAYVARREDSNMHPTGVPFCVHRFDLEVTP